MNIDNIHKLLRNLATEFEGEIHLDNTHRTIYSTDASVYKEMPAAVCIPKSESDINNLVKLASQHKLPLIPRAAGTSLAGQVVGSGIVVDISKHFKEILEVNKEEKWVKVQPGVNLDELNMYLEKYGLFFGPETSTSNRCLIGGMTGNNSCGSHSIIYGSTRDHVLEISGYLSDGSYTTFSELTTSELKEKIAGTDLENRIYNGMYKLLSDEKNQLEIDKEYPAKSINRRNTGYAIDVMLENEVFNRGSDKFNLCKLITGSEGTLMFMTEIKLNLVDVPPKYKAVIPVHFNNLDDSFKANLVALKYKPGAVEIIDKYILDCTKENIEQTKNRFFIKGDPEALMVVEFARDSKEEIKSIAQKMEEDMRSNGYGYHFPVLYDSDIPKVWALRKAGLGLLSNIPGDYKPVAVIEDTAVDVNVLPDFIKEFQEKLDQNNLECVYYAHIGSGELHLRPILNLKEPKDVDMFRLILHEIAVLVKKYKGSLCGEHGTGRLRGEFIPMMIGEHNYKLLHEVKNLWDPDNIFNPEKVVNTPKMTDKLRYSGDYLTKEFDTYFDFSSTQGMVRAIEKCNGSGDCRKSSVIGGTLCPSYQASGDERFTTRARANAFREFINNSNGKSMFDNKELYDILSWCLSCKACKSECPSSVDMAKLKAEFLQHYYNENGVPLRTKLIANITKFNRIGSSFPALFNFGQSNIVSKFAMNSIGFAKQRSFPKLHSTTLEKWISKNTSKNSTEKPLKSIYLFIDEFTNFNDVEIGKKSYLLLTKLGYDVKYIKNTESGRTYLSKGLLKQAKKITNNNIKTFSSVISENTPLLGIEPSAILTFRDEYPELCNNELKSDALKIAKNTFMIDEFLVSEIEKGNIKKESFTNESKTIKLHGHCQQKSIASTESTKKLISFPENYSVSEIPSGCCGMAGSFGYEKEHYELSMKIGNMVLFPEINKSPQDTLIAASGTSCRHQIKDGTGRDAVHPVEILYDALLK